MSDPRIGSCFDGRPEQARKAAADRALRRTKSDALTWGLLLRLDSNQ
jgi:hypothetical protein